MMATSRKSHSVEHKEYKLPGPLAVSSITGVLGLLWGGAATILRPSFQPGIRPGVVVVKFGIEGALLGGAFSCVRWALLETRRKGEITPSTRVSCSSVAGGLSAAITGTVMRLRPTVLGVMGGTLVGYIGQKSYSLLDEKNTEAITSPIAAKEPLWRRIANSKYSPMTVLTDKQYEALLREKLLRVDTEIAVLDDDIAMLHKERKLEQSKS